MSFTYEDKLIDSPYIDKIWHTFTTSDGVYVAGLDGNWDIIITRSPDATVVTVNGIGKGAARVPYKANVDSVGIALKPGVFLHNLNGEDIVDRQIVVTKDSTDFVDLDGQLFAIPTFADAEQFVADLVAAGIILTSKVVSSFDNGIIKGTSERSLRRHIAKTTGLSPYFFHQIRRAQHAVQLLQQGHSIAQAATDAGYTDQAHMTKSLKLLIGHTPAEIIKRTTK